MRKVAGIDLGGTMIKMGIVDEKDGIIDKIEFETKLDLGFEGVVKRMVGMLKELLEKNSVEISAVGIGSPGSIDHENGVIRFSPNFPGWENVPLKAEFERLSSFQVFVENDANSAVLGEKWFGAGKNKEHIVLLTLGTGIGGGVISHNILIKGHDGIGAELGHTVVEPNGPLCGCGNYGCLEAIASGSAMVRFANEGRRKFPNSKIFQLEKDRGVLGAKEIFDAFRKNDPLATRIIERFIDAMSTAIANFIHIFNPQIVILGGGISRGSDVFFDELKKRVEMKVMPSFVSTYELVVSPLLNDAGILGASAVALEALK